MLRRTIVFVALLTLLLVTAHGALAASPVVHYQLSFFEESIGELSDDGAACVGYSGTIQEQRTYDIRVAKFVAGPRAGDVHLTGLVTGPFSITPHEPEAVPVYEGAIREKISFSGTSLGDPLVFTFVVHATATGSDGSALKLVYHGHGVISREGDVKVEFDKFHCVR